MANALRSGDTARQRTVSPPPPPKARPQLQGDVVSGPQLADDALDAPLARPKPLSLRTIDSAVADAMWQPKRPRPWLGARRTRMRPTGVCHGFVLRPTTLVQGLDLQRELDRLLAKLSVLGFQSLDQSPIVTPPSSLGIGSPAAPAGPRHFESGSGFLSVR